MNKRFIFIIGVMVLLLVAWWLGKNYQKSTPKAATVPAATTSTAIPSAGVAQGQTNASAANSSSVPPLAPGPVDSKLAKIEAIVTAENAKSLDLYGKIIDQYGDPVAGVKVRAGVGLIIDFTQSGGKDYYTESDVTGKFSFVGIHGSGVGFTLTKEGYFYNQRLPVSSRPNNYMPDPGNPVIFPMWKLKGAERLVHVEGHCGLACDGTSTSFDLLTGKKISSGGDLTISLVRNPVNIDRSKPFDWTLTLQIAGGGLIPAETAYTNEAPAEGYQSSITVNMAASEKSWFPSLVQTYFFKTCNGQVYGRITANLMANYQPPPTHFEFEVYANPAGSRNLEYDPAQETKNLFPSQIKPTKP